VERYRKDDPKPPISLSAVRAAPPAVAAAATTAAATAAHSWSRLAGLARTSLQIQAKLTKHSVELTWAVVARNLDHTSANKEYLESMAREGALFWRAMSDLSVDFLAGFVDVGKSLSTAVLRELEQRRHSAGHP
jgi:hypothetical protein